jgi:hypothetical protein
MRDMIELVLFSIAAVVFVHAAAWLVHVDFLLP